MLNMVFSVTYDWELHNIVKNVIFYQVKMLMFYNVQTIKLTFVGKKWDIK